MKNPHTQTTPCIHILDSVFVSSAATIHNAPPVSLSEVAFLGRSNVGKSTLINSLLGVKGLAKSSSTPGKTQLINYFKSRWRVDHEEFSFYLVDLPGFGYAKVSKETQQKWQRSLKEFLQQRTSIKLFLQLRDARHTDLAIDDEAHEFLTHFKNEDQKILQIFTKCDKLNKNDFRRLRMKYADSLFSATPMPSSMRDVFLNRIYLELLGKYHDRNQ